MKEMLNKILTSKKAEYADLEKRLDASSDVAEVRQIGDTLLKLKDEISEIEMKLAEAEKAEEMNYSEFTVGITSKGILKSFARNNKINVIVSNESLFNIARVICLSNPINTIKNNSINISILIIKIKFITVVLYVFAANSRIFFKLSIFVISFSPP